MFASLDDYYLSQVDRFAQRLDTFAAGSYMD